MHLSGVAEKTQLFPRGNAVGEAIKKGGVLIGDGNTIWIYWPEGRPQYGDDGSDHEKAASPPT